MKFRFVFVLVVVLYALSGCGNNQRSSGSYSNERLKTAEELRQELKDVESQDPTSYLIVENTSMKENVIREATLFKDKKTDGWIVKGNIISNATEATYKDVTLDVVMYTQTDTEVGRESFVVYTYVGPKETVPFSLKVNAPNSCKSYRVTLTGASVAYNK